MKEIVGSQIGGKLYSEAISQTKVAVIDFWADWCAPCRIMMPTFNKLASEMGDVMFLKANVEENSTLASELGIAGIPAVVIYVNGEIHSHLTGLQTESKLRDAINNALNQK